MMIITKVGTAYEVTTRDTAQTFSTLQAAKAFIRAASRKRPKPVIILEPLVTTPAHAPAAHSFDAEVAAAKAEALAEQSRWDTGLPQTKGPVAQHVQNNPPPVSDRQYTRD